MRYLRAFLGVLLVMIAMVSASQSSASQNFFSNADASQSDQTDDQSDGQQGDQVATVEMVVLQKRFSLLVPPQPEKSFELDAVVSEKTVPAKSFRDVTCLMPARLLLSRSGLLPRAPSLV